MFPIRVKVCSESDLRMLGSLARNIQRVLPVTQADIDAAAALGKGWVVWKVIEVGEPLDNLRGGTQLVIKQNSVQPGQNVRRVIFVSGPGGETVVIGPAPSPLLLPDAIANSLSYVKAFGGTEQRNLPAGYTQVNYVTNTAQTAVDTGIMIDFAKNYEFEVECRATTGSWYILQSRASSSGNITGIHGATSGSTITLVVGNVTVCTSAITRTVGNKLYVKATLNAGTATLYVKDETANTEDTQTGSYGTSQPNPTAAVYLLGNAGGQYADVNSDIYMARIKENDTVVMDYVPARQVATAGFYDKASGTFKTALTPANLSADGNTIPTPNTPMDIVSNNGVLKVFAGNKWTDVGMSEGYIIQLASGTIQPNSNYNVSAPILLKAGDYSVSYYSSATGSRPFTIWESNTQGDLVGDHSVFNITRPDVGTNTGTFTIDRDMYVRVSWRVDFTDIVVAPTSAIIYTDGTVETINVHGKNLFDQSTATRYRTSWSNGGDGAWQVMSETSQAVTYGSYVKPNTTYTLSKKGGARLIITGYRTKTEPSSSQPIPADYKIQTDTTEIVGGSYTFTTPADCTWILFGLRQNNATFTFPYDVQLEQGSTATDYAPYYDGGTATAEMLLKVGDYEDVQEILSGAVTRNVGVKVFDGTETFTVSSSGAMITQIPDVAVGATNSPINTHFALEESPTSIDVGKQRFGASGTQILSVNYYMKPLTTMTVAQFQQFLADQYAAGTPVIVVYPLAEPTTESVAGQTLQVQAGDNTLEITQASMSDLELEAEYEQGVEASVEEIEP